MHWIIRALWFITIGWLLGTICLTVTALLAISIIGLPFVPMWLDLTWNAATLKDV